MPPQVRGARRRMLRHSDTPQGCGLKVSRETRARATWATSPYVLQRAVASGSDDIRGSHSPAQDGVSTNPTDPEGGPDSRPRFSPRSSLSPCISPD